MNKGNNIFTSLLGKLNVRHTKYYSSKIFNESPLRNTLYGLSQMFSFYNIENTAVKIEDKKEDIRLIELPFIAYFENSFIIVTEINDLIVRYEIERKNKFISLDKFIYNWSGIALLVELKNDSKEPGYEIHKAKESIMYIWRYIIGLTLIVLVVSSLFYSELYKNILFVILLFLNFSGIYVSCLIVLNQMTKSNKYADKICSLIKEKNCNTVLNSKASKLFGIWSWGNIGLSYFVSNTFMMLFDIQFIPYLALVNGMALPYTVWSVWYQKTRVRQWCLLCLIVQLLIWSIFFLYLLGDFFYLPLFVWKDVFCIGSIYILFFSILDFILSYMNKNAKYENIDRRINEIKYSQDIFELLLKRQLFFKIDKQVSKILFGNASAKNLITIIINPHCNPCAKIHKDVELLLEAVGDEICVQYIFTFFSKEVEKSALFLIATYFNSNKIEYIQKIYSGWFNGGKDDQDRYFNKYGYISDDTIIKEYRSHIHWCEQTNIRVTPTIMFNGYIIPDFYTVSDLKYFTDMDIL